jgi:hypothetical protein
MKATGNSPVAFSRRSVPPRLISIVIRNNVIIIHLNFLTPATYLVTILLYDS